MEKPVLQIEIVRRVDGKMGIRMWFDGIDPPGFGLLVADIVRHGAKAYKCPEDLIWEWVEREHEHPTTPIIEEKPN